MDDLEAGARQEAARRYAQLRRRYWRCFLGMPVSLVVIAAPTFAFQDELNPDVSGLLFSLFAVVWLACWLISFATWSALLGFRCPRCGKRFVLAWWTSWLTDWCKHCGLDLGSAARADAKP